MKVKIIIKMVMSLQILLKEEKQKEVIIKLLH